MTKTAVVCMSSFACTVFPVVIKLHKDLELTFLGNVMLLLLVIVPVSNLGGNNNTVFYLLLTWSKMG